MAAITVVQPAAASPSVQESSLLGAIPMSATTAGMTPAQLATQLELSPASAKATRTAPRRQSKTPQQLAAAVTPGGYLPDVDSRGLTTPGEAKAAGVDIITPDDCKQHYLDGFSGDYWHKNRFTACRAMVLLGKYQRCSNGKCTIVGRWAIHAAYVFNMANNDRATELQIKMSHLQLDPGVPGTAVLNFAVGCWDPDPTGPSCDPVTSSFEHTASQWEAIGVQSIVIRFAGESKPQPNDPALNERRSFYELNPYFYLGNGSTSDFVEAPRTNTRCDVARTAVNPQYAGTSDCVFHKVVGIFTQSVSNPEVTESAQFIRQAQTNITSTWPGIPGTYVPGRLDATPPLTRMYYDEAMRNANRTSAVASCEAGFGKNYTDRPNPSVPGEKNDCDEYPFSATHEGTYLVKQQLTPGSYAVKPVHAGHNQKLGSNLGVWEGANHVLEGDPFFTVITD